MRKLCGRLLWGILSVFIMLDAAITLGGLAVQVAAAGGK